MVVVGARTSAHWPPFQRDAKHVQMTFALRCRVLWKERAGVGSLESVFAGFLLRLQPKARAVGPPDGRATTSGEDSVAVDLGRFKPESWLVYGAYVANSHACGALPAAVMVSEARWASLYCAHDPSGICASTVGFLGKRCCGHALALHARSICGRA